MSTPRELVERALAHSRATHCTVIIDDSSAAWMRWAADTLTANGTSSGRRITVLSAVEGPHGTALGSFCATTDDPRDLEALVRASEAAAAKAPPSRETAEPLGEDGLFDDDPGPGTPAQDSLARAVPALATWQRRAVGTLYGYAGQTTLTTHLGSSSGLRRSHRGRTATLEVNARSTDGLRSAWAGATDDDLGAIDPAALEAGTSARLARALPRRTLAPGRYEVVLPPSAVADLMITAYLAAGAEDAAQGRTAFARPGGGTRLGQRLTALPLTLRSDPHEPGLRCCPFVLSRGAVADEFGATIQAGSAPADNGLPLAPVDWIKDGVLTSLLSTRAGAARLGLPARPAIGNLVLDGGGTRSLSDLVASTRRGLLLTCLWYMRVTDGTTLSLTGLTRDGVYLVEDGQITAEVDDFRFAESPLSLLARAVEAGRTEKTLAREFGMHFPRTAMPALRIPDFLMTSVAPGAGRP